MTVCIFENNDQRYRRPVFPNLQGKIRFEAPFEAETCATVGGGESAPGDGGCILNGATGKLVFKKELTMTDCGTFVSGFYL